MDNFVEVRELSKSFENFKALDNLNMTIRTGSIYGLVGVNGSGKTTLIKHLANIYKADGGTIKISGEDAFDNEKVKSLTAYVSDDLYFFAAYNLRMLTRFYASMYKNWDGERFDAIVKLMGLDKKKRIGGFSKGMQKQAALALTLSTKPDFLLLDEPIDGLDPIVRKRIFDWLIDDVAERSMTVLISSHNLKEMDGICDTVGIIKDGRMLTESDLDELKDTMHKRAISGKLEPTLDEIFIFLYEEAAGHDK